MFVACPLYFFKQVTEADKMGCDHKAYTGELTHIEKVGIGASYSLIWVCSGIEFIEYAEMFGVPIGLNDVKYSLTATRLCLEEAVSGRGIGDVQIAMDIIERCQFGLLIESIPCLL